MPLRLIGAFRKLARNTATDLMQRLGIAASAGRRPGQVSGGQAQRAAAARAVIHKPAYVFADERPVPSTQNPGTACSKSC